MIRGLITFSLRYPPVIMVLAFVLLVAGGIALRDATWDVFPEFAPPQVIVQTEAPGFSAEEVEQLIAIPVEAAINGVGRLKTLRSSSVPGLCVVTAIFEEGTRLLDARQLVAERLIEVRSRLPEAAQEPRLMPLTSSTSRLLMVGLTSEQVSSMSLRTVADWTFRRRLQAVRGVAHVEVFGGDVKQYQILIAPERLKQYDVSLTQVQTAARSATGFGGAGFLETPNQRLPIRQRTRLESAADIEAVPVAVREGVTLPLGHVATVAVGAADKVGSTRINGKPGVLLVIHKQPDFNTLTVTTSVQHALDELRASLPDGVELHPALFRQATFIERAISNLRNSILVGIVLVTLVLVAFLWQWRTLAISLTAIPLSLLGAVLVLRGFEASLNAMTLGGLAIALGEVVDDAIVDVENVLRRLKDNRLRAEPLPEFDVVLAASLEVRSAVVYASFIVILAFLPVFSLEGLAGKFFGPLAQAYVIAILVSLGVALTVTPAMCLWLLSGSAIDPDHETRLIRILNAMYRRVLPLFLRWRVATLAAALLLIMAAGAALPFLGGEFLPDFRESNFVVFMAGKPDSSLAESERMGTRLAERLQQIHGVKSVAQQIGRADLSEDTWGPNVSEVWIVMDERADYDAVLDQIREATEEFPGSLFQTKQFLRERIDEVLTGSTADIVVRVVGPDLGTLRTKSREIAEAIHDIKGVFDLRVEQQVDVPQVELLLKPREAARYGFSVGEVNQALQTLLRGTRVGQVFENDTVFDVVVRAAADLRRDPLDLGELLLDSPSGEKIPVKAVAQLALTPAPNLINREQGRRRMLVTCNAEDRDVASVVADIRRRIGERVPLTGTGCHLEFAGEFQAKADAQQRLLLVGAAALVGIWLLLYLDFRSARLSLMVMLSVPLACVGGVASVLLSGGSVSLGSLVGFVTVFGVAVRNGILLISNYQHLQEADSTTPLTDLVLRGSVERLSPILMTAATTALAILPLIVAGNLPGQEIEYPMAIVIMGGLLSSTFLTLFVLPSMYLTFSRNALRRR
ncbi:MAG: efflux RND transporter permease subunit [Planctomycetales bacterium]|nr:efflux RND transporter permease subunit [Planctomycetales bacterium]